MITRDTDGRVILIETPTAIVREKSGVYYLLLDDGSGGEFHARLDVDLGLSAWHRPPERPVEPVTTEPMPNNILKLERKS